MNRLKPRRGGFLHVDHLADCLEPNGDCWEYMGARRNGYGRMHVDGKMQQAHRAIYEFLVGPISEGLFLDHLCRNTACCNPDHLEPVTARENTRRGARRAGWTQHLTTCNRGHELTGDNVAYWHRALPHKRSCKACYRLRAALRREAVQP